MPQTLVHRGYHSGNDQYYYWVSSSWDPNGNDYTGPPPFNELSGIAVVSVTEGGETPAGTVAQLPWAWRTRPGEDARIDGWGVQDAGAYDSAYCLRPAQGDFQYYAEGTNVPGDSPSDYDRHPTVVHNAVGDKPALLFTGHQTHLKVDSTDVFSGQPYAGSKRGGLTIVVVAVPFLSKAEQGNNMFVWDVFGNAGRCLIAMHRDTSRIYFRNPSKSIEISNEITWPDPEVPEVVICLLEIGAGSPCIHTIVDKGSNTLANGPTTFDPNTMGDYESGRLIDSGCETIGMQAKTFNEDERAFVGFVCETGVIQKKLTSDEKSTLTTYLKDKWSETPDASYIGWRADLCRDAFDYRQASMRQHQYSPEVSDGDEIAGRFGIPLSKHYLLDGSPRIIDVDGHQPGESPIYRKSALNGGPCIEVPNVQSTGEIRYSSTGDVQGQAQLSLTGSGLVIVCLADPSDGTVNSLNTNVQWVLNYRSDGAGWGFGDQFGLAVSYDGSDTFVRFMTPYANSGGADIQHTMTGFSDPVLITGIADFGTGTQELIVNGSTVASESITLTKIESDPAETSSGQGVELGNSELKWTRQSQGTNNEKRHFSGLLGPVFFLDGVMDPTDLQNRIKDEYSLKF